MSDRTPTAGDIAALEIVERITEHSNGVYQMAATGRDFRRSVAIRCEAAGWLESGQCVTVDGDGFLPNGNERWGVGYKLTDAGRAVLKEAHRHRELDGLQLKVNRLVSERNEARALVEKLLADQAKTVLTCVYCGHEYPANTPAHGGDVSALTEHIAVCEKHPMRAVVDLLKEAAHALDGDDLIQHRSAKFKEWFAKNQTGLGQR